MGMLGAAKNIRLTDRVRRLVRITIGLTLLPLSFLTIALFLVTGGPVPEDFTSWRDLGCGILLAHPGPAFSGITKCGRVYLTVARPRNAALPYHVEFHDLLTSERIGAASQYGLEFAFSKSKKNVLLHDPSGVHLTELVTGNRLATFDSGEPIQFCPNVGTNSVLLRSENNAEVWDMETGQRLRSVSRPRMPVSFGFNDGAREPKCITVVQPWEKVELRDESSGLCELVLKEGNSRITGPVGSPFTSAFAFKLSPDCGMIAIPDGRLITIRSLTDKPLVRTVQEKHGLRFGMSRSKSALIQSGSNLRFSFNNLWLTQEYRIANPLVARAAGVGAALNQWLARWLPDENCADLINLETGETWERIPAGHGVAFSEGDSCLITFGDKGRYLWSVPPRMQWFTPWAFAPLGAWLGLAVCWWKMRRRTVPVN